MKNNDMIIRLKEEFEAGVKIEDEVNGMQYAEFKIDLTQFGIQKR